MIHILWLLNLANIKHAPDADLYFWYIIYLKQRDCVLADFFPDLTSGYKEVSIGRSKRVCPAELILKSLHQAK